MHTHRHLAWIEQLVGVFLCILEFFLISLQISTKNTNLTNAKSLIAICLCLTCTTTKCDNHNINMNLNRKSNEKLDTNRKFQKGG